MTALVVVRATARCRFLRGIVGNLRDNGGGRDDGQRRGVHTGFGVLKNAQTGKKNIERTEKQPTDKLVKSTTERASLHGTGRTVGIARPMGRHDGGRGADR